MLLSDKVIVLNNKIKSISLKNIKQKVADYILQEYKSQKQLIVNLKMNKEEIANFIGIPRPSLSRELIKLRKEKIIDNASCISYNNKYYIPINLATGETVNFQKGTKCILIIDYDGEYIGEIEDRYYKMLELEDRNSVMKKESEITDSKLEKEHHKYIPPKNHPWRKNMMLNH